MHRHAPLLFPLLLLSLGACDRNQGASDATADAGAAPPAASVPATTPEEAPTQDPGVLSSHGQRISEGPANQPASAGTAGIDFDLPAGWQSQPPASSMRIAQAVIPGPGGAGDLAVFYFGAGGGGTVQANLDRWVNQMDSQGPKPEPETFETNGLKVTWIEVRGTLQPSGMGMGPTTPQPNSRLLGAVVEGPGGPWFFKATGPDATLAKERDGFLKMLHSVRPK
jgi:hypothetical protein